MKMYSGMPVCVHAFLTPELHGDEQSASLPDSFT